MTDDRSDRDLIRTVWETYDDAFADHVGAVVDPREHFDTETQVDQLARVFMLGYALGSIAGAQTVDPDAVRSDVDVDRVEAVVDHVVEVHESDEFAASSGRIAEDFLED